MSTVAASRRFRRSPESRARLGSSSKISPLTDADALERSGRVLLDVLELADRMPSRPRGELTYPPLIGLAS